MNDETVAKIIERKLAAALAPVSVEVEDESRHHEGHAGHRPGGQSHFRVYIVSEAFEGKSRVQRHRMINDALAEELPALHISDLAGLSDADLTARLHYSAAAAEPLHRNHAEQVAGNDDGRPFLDVLLQNEPHFANGMRIEACKRFIKNQDIRFVDQRTGKHKLLFHAARKRAGQKIGSVGQFQLFDQTGSMVQEPLSPLAHPFGFVLSGCIQFGKKCNVFRNG